MDNFGEFLRKNHLEKWSTGDYCNVIFGAKTHFLLGQIRSTLVVQDKLIVLLTSHENADGDTTPPFGRNVACFDFTGNLLWFIQSASKMYPRGMRTYFSSIRLDQFGEIMVYDGSCEAKVNLLTGELHDPILAK